MCVLREVESQHEWLGSSILNFHPAIRKCGLCNESNLRIDLAEDHILMIFDLEFSNTTATTIGMKQCGALRAKSRLSPRG
jgi:hypothetical protein